MPKLKNKLIRLAYENPKFRPDLLPLLKEATEFSTEKARKEYLKEHPNADPKNHTVKEPSAEDGKSKEDKPKPTGKFDPKRWETEPEQIAADYSWKGKYAERKLRGLNTHTFRNHEMMPPGSDKKKEWEELVKKTKDLKDKTMSSDGLGIKYSPSEMADLSAPKRDEYIGHIEEYENAVNELEKFQNKIKDEWKGVRSKLDNVQSALSVSAKKDSSPEDVKSTVKSFQDAVKTVSEMSDNKDMKLRYKDQDNLDNVKEHVKKNLDSLRESLEKSMKDKPEAKHLEIAIMLDDLDKGLGGEGGFQKKLKEKYLGSKKKYEKAKPREESKRVQDEKPGALSKLKGLFKRKKANMSLKNKLIRLAYQNPEFRQPIMGILKEAYDDDPTFEDFKKSIPAVYAKLKGTLHSLFRGRSSLKASAKRGFIELGGEIDYQETRVELSISWDDRRKEPEIEVQVRAAEEGDDLDYKTSVDFYGDPESDAQVTYNKIKRIVENPYWSA